MKRFPAVKLNKKQQQNLVRARKSALKQNDNDNSPLAGVFSWGSFAGTAPLSQPYQLAYDSGYSLISLNRVLLSYFYATHGIIQTVIDQPVEDAFRGGLELKSDELDAEDIKSLKDYVDYFLIPAVKSTMKWCDLFGGAGIIINTDQNPLTELNVDAIGQDAPLAFIPADRWELCMSFNAPAAVQCPFNYYGQPIHKSRVIKVDGKEAPSFIRQRLQGWGMSVIERLVRDTQMYTKNQDVLFELIDEAKIDVWRINDYNANILNGNTQGIIANRLQQATMGKNYHNALILDKEDEYEQKQVTLAGLADIMVQLRIGIAAAAKMPLTKLFGLSAAGFNSGEDDIENYNSMVESEVRAKARKILIETIPMACRQLFGFEPKVDFEFKPLRVLSAEQEENIKTAKFNRISALFSQGMYTGQEYYEKLRREGLEDMDTEVGKGVRDPEPPQSAMRTDIPQMPAKAKEAKENARKRRWF